MGELERKATYIREETLKMIHRAKAGHLGGSMSSVDILVALFYNRMKYDPKNPSKKDRDRFLLSKGHSVEGYYTILGDVGFFDSAELESYSQYNSIFIGHPNNKVPGVEMCTGALGHGLACGVGMALGAKIDEMNNFCYVLMGDGELAEGSIWEAAMAGANYKLDNLVGIIDRNMLQITGCTEDVMALGNLKEKWQAFGWSVKEVNGHSMDELKDIFDQLPFEKGKPSAIIAHTVKGKGICFAENNAKWHHGVPTETEYQTAMGVLQEEVCNEE